MVVNGFKVKYALYLFYSYNLSFSIFLLILAKAFLLCAYYFNNSYVLSSYIISSYLIKFSIMRG